ncbi:MAG: S-layer homology domain-containing protein [Bacillota bacterium]|nr:S-layer homology domain-containing protein [Bacillota bacterium]
MSVRKTGRKRGRRLLAAVLTVALLFTGSAAGSFAADSSTDSAVSMLAAMGVISADSSGSYDLNSNVTRAAWAKMLVMASPYKDQVAAGAYSAPFKDVAATHWAAAYIKVAVSNGLMSGYSDGSFRPDSTVTLAQAVNSVLLLLGYTQSDFQGAFPYAQMNIYNSIGLSQNIAVSTHSSSITRGDAADLLYNALGTNVKDGSQKYAATLGYSVNSSGQVDYAGIISSNMYGPYTVSSASDWASLLGVDTASVTVYKNGSQVTAADISAYDILYYSADKSTVWAYNSRATGIYESASPSQDAATSVTVSGTVYELESTAAFTALSSGGTLKIGDAVTLLLGKDGGVADAVAAADIDDVTVLYVTQSGSKSYEDANGNAYTSRYIAGVTADGRELEYPVTVTWISEGDTVKLSFSSGSMRVSRAGSSSVYGEVDADDMTIGSKTVADSVKIIDTYAGSYVQTGMSRLDGLTLSSDSVLYCDMENGKITRLFLNNVTGDAMDYGVVLSAVSNSSSSGSSGSYSYDLDGTTHNLNFSDKALSNVSKGPAAIYTSGGETRLKNLPSLSKITDVTSSYVVAGGNRYYYAAEVKVYEKTSSSYRLSTVADAVAAAEEGGSLSFYYDFDKTAAKGARVRVIIIN